MSISSRKKLIYLAQGPEPLKVIRFAEKEPYDVFWCELHKPQQRGTVENTTGNFIRTFFEIKYIIIK